MILDVFALVVIGVLITVVIWLVALLGPMPAKVARRRRHPQADAIGVLGWIGILTLGPAWLAALVWAYTRPTGAVGLGARVAELEAALRRLESVQGDEAA